MKKGEQNSKKLRWISKLFFAAPALLSSEKASASQNSVAKSGPTLKHSQVRVLGVFCSIRSSRISGASFETLGKICRVRFCVLNFPQNAFVRSQNTFAQILGTLSRFPCANSLRGLVVILSKGKMC